jgi:hypothetical protein
MNDGVARLHQERARLDDRIAQVEALVVPPNSLRELALRCSAGQRWDSTLGFLLRSYSNVSCT